MIGRNHTTSTTEWSNAERVNCGLDGIRRARLDLLAALAKRIDEDLLKCLEQTTTGTTCSSPQSTPSVASIGDVLKLIKNSPASFEPLKPTFENLDSNIRLASMFGVKVLKSDQANAVSRLPSV